MSMIHRHSRIVGYGSILVVTLLVAGFAFHVWRMTERGHETVMVRFDGSGELIGALQPDDPVLINGVDAGQVESFFQVPGGVRVLLRFWGHQELFRDAFAVNTSYSLMGQRVIALQPGRDSLHPLPRGQSIPGIFDPGIAEVMSQIYKVLDAVVSLRRGTVQLVRGDSAHEALHRRLMGVLDGVDGTLAGLDRLSTGVTKAGTVMDGTSRQVRGINASLPGIDAQLRSALLGVDSAIASTRRVLDASRPVLDSTRRFAAFAADSTGPMRRILHDDSLLLVAARLEKGLDTLMVVLEGRVPMKFRFHVLGSNPSKKGL